MTANLADFIASRAGELYGRYCQHYGKDPGAAFSDDVLGFQVGMAYMVRDAFKAQAEHDASDERPEGRIVTDLDRRVR